MELPPTEILPKLQRFPVTGDRGREPDTVQVWPDAENPLHTPNHDRRGRTGKPVYMGAAEVRTGFALGELSVTIRLDTTNLRLVILEGGDVFPEVAESPVSMTQ